MGRERVARFFNRLDQRVTEFLVSEMLTHSVHEFLPKSFAALFMDRFIADNR